MQRLGYLGAMAVCVCAHFLKHLHMSLALPQTPRGSAFRVLGLGLRVESLRFMEACLLLCFLRSRYKSKHGCDTLGYPYVLDGIHGEPKINPFS